MMRRERRRVIGRRRTEVGPEAADAQGRRCDRWRTSSNGVVARFEN